LQKRMASEEARKKAEEARQAELTAAKTEAHKKALDERKKKQVGLLEQTQCPALMLARCSTPVVFSSCVM
jgi:hypothetical protein